MSNNIKIIFIVLTILLASCFAETPDCSDSKTINLVQQIVFEQLVKFDSSLTNKNRLNNIQFSEIADNIRLDYSRPVKFEKEINKYTCSTNVIYPVRTPNEYKEWVDKVGYGGLIFGEYSLYAKQISQYFDQNENVLRMTLEYSSQKVDMDNHYVEVFLNTSNFLALHQAIYLNREFGDSVGKEKFSLTETDKEVIDNAIIDFEKAYSEGGISLININRDKCYKFAASVDDRNTDIQCVAFDVVSSQVIPAIEKMQGFPKAEGFTFEEVQSRAQKGLKKRISNENYRNQLIDAISKEVQRNLQSRLPN